MPLSLITGPANAAKAGAVLERLRAAVARAPSPLLVVPTSQDREHYARELAASGLVFGVEVATFSHLVRTIAARTGLEARPLGRVARARVVRAAVADVPLGVLARSARTPGFAAAAERLFAELQGAHVAPARFTAALRAWNGVAHAEELAALYAAYHRRLARLGRTDPEGHAWAALDALRAAPAAWEARPVFFYGFDDFTPIERDAVETLAVNAGAEVCVALPSEPGRVALAGCAATVEELRPLAAGAVTALPERSEHYAPAARRALHHLERGLFEPAPEPREPNGAVRLLEAGGERAEAELVGAEVLELMRKGVGVEDIAVLLRGDAATTALFAQVLAGYGIPVAHEREVPFAATRLGAGLLAGARAARPGGLAADLLAWLRTPERPEGGARAEGFARGDAPAAAGGDGGPDGLARVDALEAVVRREGVAGAREARAQWERAGGAPPAALDALAAAAEEGAVALLDALEAEAEALWTAPHRRRAAVLGAEALVDARAAAALRSAARELRALAGEDPALAGGPDDVLEALAAVPVREPLGQAAMALGSIATATGAGADGATGGAAQAGVLLTDPLGIRARRFRAVFVCGLQEGGFPRRPPPEPFLSDEDRRGLALATGLRLPGHEDVLARERTLFYGAVSRPEDVLFLSWRSSDEEGAPLAPSPFLDDVRALFTDGLWTQRGTRLLASVTWAPREAPTPHELRRALAAAQERPDPPPLAAPASAAVLAALAARPAEPARGLEAFAACGVRWLVEQLLRPRTPEPDPEALTRGALAHAVLERTLERLRAQGGSAAITPRSLPAALEALEEALAAIAREGGVGARRRALLRGLRADLERYLRGEAEGGAGWEPRALEWSFGGAEDAHGPLALGEAGSAVTGRVDRVDAGPGGAAIVRDYKGRTVSPGARWVKDGQLQVPLYLLAVREHLGLEPAGGLYQPLAGAKLAPRGLVRDDVPGDYTGRDVVDPHALEAALEQARELAARTVADLRAGRVRPCPERCSSRGCRHPAICRAGEPRIETPA